MTTTVHPPTASSSAMNQVIGHVSLKMAQTASLIVPPTYILMSLIRRNPAKPFSIKRLMNVSTAGVLGFSAAGLPMGYARLSGQTPESLEDRAFRLHHNPTQVRSDDYSIIGAALGALLVPAVFLRRASLPALVLGGASIGLGGGVWVHLAKAFQQGEDIRPEGMVGEIPIVGGNDNL